METAVLTTLRPLGLGELLDRAIRLYRANFLTFIGIIAIAYVPLMLLQSAASALMSSSISRGVSTPQQLFSNYGYWIAIVAALVLALVRFILVQGIATGALARAVADNYLGKKTGILDAYREIGKSWPTLLGALLFIILIVFVLLLWWLIPCVGWLTGLGMLLFLGSVINPLVPPVVVLEKQGAIKSVQRAWSLARRRFWPVLGYVFVLMLFSLIVVNGPVAIVNVVLGRLLVSFGNSTEQLIISTIIQGLVSLVFVLLYYPLQMTAFTVIYFDLRVRTEGFDLALLAMDTAGSTDIQEVAAIPVPQTNERLITGPDLGNFAIVTLIGAGLYILFFSFITGSVLFFTSLLR